MKNSYLLLCWVILTPMTIFAASPDYQLFVEPDAGRAPLLNAIENAQKEIDVVMYLWTDKKIAQALMKAQKRGVSVNVLIEKSPYEGEAINTWLTNFWQDTRIHWQWAPQDSSPLNFYHEKMMLIDHRAAWVMTLNFVNSSFNRKYPVRNFLLLDQNPTEVQAIQALFESDWQGKTPVLQNNLNLVVSPVNSRAQLEALIENAQRSLNIYTDGLDDYALIGKLAQAARRGVTVEIICGGKIIDKAKKYLQKNKVAIYVLDENSPLKNHAKAMIVDDQMAFIGSENFTQNSLDSNRELGIMSEESTIISGLKQQFIKDWQLLSL